MTSSTPPGARTTLADVLSVLAVADSVGAGLWVDGGWGVDALLGEETREHGDLDVAIEQRHLAGFVDGLGRSGFRHVDEDCATPWNFLVANESGAVVDLHVIVLDEEGNGVLGPPEAGNVFPADSLTGRGRLGGHPVRCISPEWVVRFHDGYAGDEDDRHDVRRLCDRFDLPVPDQYR